MHKLEWRKKSRCQSVSNIIVNKSDLQDRTIYVEGMILRNLGMLSKLDVIA